MKKKSLIAMGISLSMVLAMATPAFAANTNVNVNADGTEVTAPGNPSYTLGGNTQTANQSYNEAVSTSTNGTAWETVNDDDKLAGVADTNGADINVWAKVLDAKTKEYKVDFAWGAMQFEYNSVGSTKWNPATHSYDKGDKTAAWTTTYLDAANNKVAVTNHSNNAIDAGFAYKMEGIKFNDANGQNNVIGNFFDDNTKAIAAALVISGTYTDATSGVVNEGAVANKLAGSKVTLATADAYNGGANAAGARTDDVFFAFSGAPDDGKGKALDAFKKVGVITVTVTPNTTANIN